ncbi:MAG TPA: homoserine kinase [Chitinophagales bacterium]
MKKSICVAAPATVANLGSGFDLIGLAIEKTADKVEVSMRDDKQIVIQNITGDNGLLPRNADENTCTVAIKSLLKRLKIEQGFDVILHKEIGFNSGLGSSASSAVAGVFAVNELLGNPLSKFELIHNAVDGEYIASKGFHADNVAPCMLGGITFIQDLNPLTIEQIAFHADTHIVVLYQYVSISTAQARAILPAQYERKTLTRQSARIASLLFGLSTNNKKYLSLGLGDEIATPYRKKLIPHFDVLQETALRENAIGFNISGSGPAVFAWCADKKTAEIVSESWRKLMRETGEKFELFDSAINPNGVIVS